MTVVILLKQIKNVSMVFEMLLLFIGSWVYTLDKNLCISAFALL